MEGRKRARRREELTAAGCGRLKRSNVRGNSRVEKASLCPVLRPAGGRTNPGRCLRSNLTKHVWKRGDCVTDLEGGSSRGRYMRERAREREACRDLDMLGESLICAAWRSRACDQRHRLTAGTGERRSHCAWPLVDFLHGCGIRGYTLHTHASHAARGGPPSSTPLASKRSRW